VTLLIRAKHLTFNEIVIPTGATCPGVPWKRSGEACGSLLRQPNQRASAPLRFVIPSGAEGSAVLKPAIDPNEIALFRFPEAALANLGETLRVGYVPSASSLS
jgi:hypothetical protein